MQALAALLFTLLVLAPAAGAGELAAPRLAIIIDDLGNTLADGRRAVTLPGPVACAVLPHTTHGPTLAEEAYRLRKEVMLHLPMEANGEDYEPGPGQLDGSMTALEFDAALDYNLATVPHATGINNHMGSRLTAQREPMERLMRLLRQRRNLFFVDSMTSPTSVAAQVAREQRVPVVARDVFLDNERHETVIEHQLDEALRIARQRGQALAIGHPYPETLAVLERRLPQLRAQGIELVPPSALLPPTSREDPVWPVSLSR